MIQLSQDLSHNSIIVSFFENIAEEEIVQTKMNFSVEVSLFNHTQHILSSVGEYPVYISYHWLTEEGAEIVHDGLRTIIHPELASGAHAQYTMQIVTPVSAGIYKLKLAVVQEDVRWFENSTEKNERIYIVEQ